MRTRMNPTNSRSTSAPSPARTSRFFAGMSGFVAAPLSRGQASRRRAGGWFFASLLLLLASCASFDGRGLVPGQSTQRDVEAIMGQPADKRVGAQGEIIYWYPQLQYGYASYAARIGPDGR